MKPQATTICIAGGKGGTGKTTVAVNLAYCLAQQGMTVAYLDGDVEEPNGHLFLQPTIDQADRVTVPIPQVDPDRCQACGDCADICEFNAITVVNGQVLIFPELCHSCGGCHLVCPTEAIQEVPQGIGSVESGTARGIQFVQGRLDIGQVKTPSLIQAVKERLPGTGMAILDAPPGTSCPVVEAVRGVDYLVLVTEPTPFGLHDLKLVIGMAKALQVSFGIVVNRAGLGDRALYDYCAQEQIEILAEIPHDREVAIAYSQGQLAAEVLPAYRRQFTELAQTLVQKVAA